VSHGTTTQSVVLFRDGAVDGDILVQISRSAQTAAGDIVDRQQFFKPISFPSGIYVHLSGGTGTSATVQWDEE
jgi:hypothetical protein